MPYLLGRHWELQELEAAWAAIYNGREQQLGATATLVNFGDQPNAGKVDAATLTGMRFSATGLAPVWTPNEALSAFDTKFDLTNPANWQGIIPTLPFNGTDEEMDTPDADYWSRVETAAFSIGFWIRPTDITSVTLLSKWNATGTLREWKYGIGSTSKLELLLYDESVDIEVSRPSSASITVSVWSHVVVTYTGDGGADAADSINLYINGAASNGTAVNNISYVAMENLATVVQLGAFEGATLYAGRIAGGPCCPWFCQAELTAAQIKNMYDRERLAMGV